MTHIPTHASYLADVARAAHQTGKDLTLDDVAAVIEAVNSLAAADDTLARTGNTARDWELTCHECAGHGYVLNWRQVAERKTDMQEFKEECECCEGRGFVFAFQDIPGIEEYVKGCRPAPAAPGVSTVEDAQEGNDVLSWLEVEIGALSCRYHGDPSYDHDAYWMRDRILNLIEDARKAFCAPAAGDALDAAAPEWMTCDKRGWMVRESLTRNAKQMRTNEKRCRNAYQQEYMGAPTRWLADVYALAAAVFERKLDELAAQRKGDA